MVDTNNVIDDFNTSNEEDPDDKEDAQSLTKTVNKGDSQTGIPRCIEIADSGDLLTRVHRHR